MTRLSVDIDLDFHSDTNRDTVLKEREEVLKLLLSYLEREGYRILPKSKNYFALESIVVGFTNNAGNNDNIKIEINYLLRRHAFPIVKRRISTEIFGETGEVSTLDGIELLAAKTAAFYNRLAARDFYDIYNVSQYGILSNDQYNIYCHCVVFYRTLTSDAGKLDFSPKIVDKLQARTIAQDLYPMLVKRVDFDLEKAKTQVKTFLAESIVITPSLQQYIDSFNKKVYRPELLFSGEMLERVKEHPMAIWKTSQTGIDRK